MPAVNYLAILACAVAYMIFMALWYSPLLAGKFWVKAFGKSVEEMEAMKKDAWKGYAVAFVCALVLAFTLSVILHGWGIHRLAGAVKLSVLAGFGISAASWLPSIMFERRPMAMFVIDAGGSIISMVIMGVILSLWK